jgi:hypothetical protein
MEAGRFRGAEAPLIWSNFRFVLYAGRSHQLSVPDVPARTMAMVRSSDSLQLLSKETAIAALFHQRRLTHHAEGSTAERTVGPAGRLRRV